MVNNGSAVERGIKNDGDRGECSVVLTLHYKIGFVAYTKEALAKSRERREELGRRTKEKKGMGCHRGHPIQTCAK